MRNLVQVQEPNPAVSEKLLATVLPSMPMRPFHRTFLGLLLFSLLASSYATAAAKPKLILAVVVDQFRYDYLTRFRGDYHAGLARLLNEGAVFTDAHYIQFPTVTAIGHSTFLSGATPSVSGIIANEWFERATN